MKRDVGAEGEGVGEGGGGDGEVVAGTGGEGDARGEVEGAFENTYGDDGAEGVLGRDAAEQDGVAGEGDGAAEVVAGGLGGAEGGDEVGDAVAPVALFLVDVGGGGVGGGGAVAGDGEGVAVEGDVGAEVAGGAVGSGEAGDGRGGGGPGAVALEEVNAAVVAVADGTAVADGEGVAVEGEGRAEAALGDVAAGDGGADKNGGGNAGPTGAGFLVEEDVIGRLAVAELGGGGADGEGVAGEGEADAEVIGPGDGVDRALVGGDLLEAVSVDLVNEGRALGGGERVAVDGAAKGEGVAVEGERLFVEAVEGIGVGGGGVVGGGDVVSGAVAPAGALVEEDDLGEGRAAGVMGAEGGDAVAAEGDAVAQAEPCGEEVVAAGQAGGELAVFVNIHAAVADAGLIAVGVVAEDPGVALDGDGGAEAGGLVNLGGIQGGELGPVAVDTAVLVDDAGVAVGGGVVGAGCADVEGVAVQGEGNTDEGAQVAADAGYRDVAREDGREVGCGGPAGGGFLVNREGAGEAVQTGGAEDEGVARDRDGARREADGGGVEADRGGAEVLNLLVVRRVVELDHVHPVVSVGHVEGGALGRHAEAVERKGVWQDVGELAREAVDAVDSEIAGLRGSAEGDVEEVARGLDGVAEAHVVRIIERAQLAPESAGGAVVVDGRVEHRAGVGGLERQGGGARVADVEDEGAAGALELEARVVFEKSRATELVGGVGGLVDGGGLVEAAVAPAGALGVDVNLAIILGHGGDDAVLDLNALTEQAGRIVAVEGAAKAGGDQAGLEHIDGGAGVGADDEGVAVEVDGLAETNVLDGGVGADAAEAGSDALELADGVGDGADGDVFGIEEPLAVCAGGVAGGGVHRAGDAEGFEAGRLDEAAVAGVRAGAGGDGAGELGGAVGPGDDGAAVAGRAGGVGAEDGLVADVGATGIGHFEQRGHALPDVAALVAAAGVDCAAGVGAAGVNRRAQQGNAVTPETDATPLPCRGLGGDFAGQHQSARARVERDLAALVRAAGVDHAGRGDEGFIVGFNGDGAARAGGALGEHGGVAGDRIRLYAEGAAGFAGDVLGAAVVFHGYGGDFNVAAVVVAHGLDGAGALDEAGVGGENDAAAFVAHTGGLDEAGVVAGERVDVAVVGAELGDKGLDAALVGDVVAAFAETDGVGAVEPAGVGEDVNSSAGGEADAAGGRVEFAFVLDGVTGEQDVAAGGGYFAQVGDAVRAVAKKREAAAIEEVGVGEVARGADEIAAGEHATAGADDDAVAVEQVEAAGGGERAVDF